jgi:serine/threonine-protein kinase
VDALFCHERARAIVTVILGIEVGLSIGQTVGEYRVVDVIGAGGMGTVYKVQHLISERIEAMKVILPELIESPELADRFIREIKVQARLSHPNIASLHNALRLDNQFLMVMEYIDGSSLHARLRHGSIDPAGSIDIVVQVLSALAYAHSQGVIHRDIKPANIMFTSSGVAKLMDFGIARSLSDQHLTRAGAAVGSVYYMSPEQIQATEVDCRSDIYSVGIMLYEMATGTRPITGDSSWAVMNAHLNLVPRAPSAINPNLPPALSAAIQKAIEKNPAARFQSAAEFSDALKSTTPANFAYQNFHLHATEVAHSPGPPTPLPEVPQPLLNPVRATPPYPATPTPSAPQTAGGEAAATRTVRFDPDGLERVTRELATYVGPMAKLLVGRAAKKAASWKQLYDLLATEVPEGPERKRFLSKRPIQ